jgi:hypothetical protein
VLLRVDADHRILSSVVKSEVQKYLSRHVREACQSQWADGSWDIRWSPTAAELEPSPKSWPSNLEKVHATGHLLEWFITLPDDLQPPVDVIRRGADFLARQVESLTLEEFLENFCPYTHAIAATRLRIRTG